MNRLTPRLATGLLSAVLAALLVSTLSAQSVPENKTPQPRPTLKEELRLPPRRPDMPVDPQALHALRRRLIELDRLLTLGSVGRAQALLDDLSQHSELERELMSRRIRLAQAQDDHAAAVTLCREALADQELNPGLWRSLAASLLAVGEPDSARLAVDKFMLHSPNRRSAAIVGVELFHRAERYTAALALLDSLRTVLGEPRFLGIERVVGLLAADRQAEAAAETAGELRANPFNLALLRTDLLDGPYQSDTHKKFRRELAKLAADAGAVGAEALLLANLHLVGGDHRDAITWVEPLIGTPGGGMLLLQNAVILLRELEMEASPTQTRATGEYLLTVLAKLSEPLNRDQGLRRRAADLLAEVCEKALLLGVLEDDPQASVARFATLLDLVRKVNPQSDRLYSSQIRLAAYTRDTLQDPAGAARGLERLLLDLDLPTEGVALVRLTLGECYLAAGDTARGRTVLTSLGRDPEFRRAGGYAHYHLARLDLAEGHFATARDRFAVIALDNPSAPYANDALELGLAIAEEMDNPTGGPSVLALYARSVYHDLMAQPTERVAALTTFVEEAARRVDLDEPQHLLERGRFELATALAEVDRRDDALTQLDAIVAQHPDGRYPAAALQRRGQLLRDEGSLAAARRAWERLLAQYPEYLFIDDVRDALRGLPN